MADAMKAALAMAAMMGLGIGPGRDVFEDDWPSMDSQRMRGFAPVTTVPTFTSEKPLTKRQRRRLRGKQGSV